ncbi:hypothetical protein BDV95DRAFT_563457 [Massariosphaeria phaeospora]|uniref:F-box domain-containing protein n=1 Tax=Massariosphaeria phaeospora TaxID=100035 RepID=A0A7C8IE33_9PLEO|nr:hypothetical protein BDV95DRAFT_563457 [Massariosphaeria phaeospora]
MDRAPLEIISAIVRELLGYEFKKESVADYATLNWTWRVAVEANTFRQFTLHSPDFGAFATMYAEENVMRRTYMRELIIYMELPHLEESCILANRPDRKADGLHFTTQLNRLFSILSDISSRCSKPSPSICLAFNSETRPSSSRHLNGEYTNAVADAGFYQIDHPERLPHVPNVREFRFSSYYGQGLYWLHKRCAGEIMAKCDSLEKVHFKFRDPYKWGEYLRKQQRAYISEGLCLINTDNLKQAKIEIQHEGMDNESLDVHKVATLHDPLRTALWHLALLPQLAVLHLTGPVPVTPEFFSTTNLEAGINIFPALQELFVEISAETADGRWYFIRDEELYEIERSDPDGELVSDSDDDQRSADSTSGTAVYGTGPERIGWEYINRFRCLPNPETVTPLLTHAASAAMRMKRMRKMTLHLTGGKGWLYPTTAWYANRRFELQYVKQGTARDIGNRDELKAEQEHRDCIYWRVGKWRPAKDVQHAWDEVIGSSGKMIFLA